MIRAGVIWLAAMVRRVRERLDLTEQINSSYYQLLGAQVGRNSRIKKHVVIHNPSKLNIGEGTVIGDFVHIWAGGGLKIGSNVLIAAHTMLTTDAHDLQAVACHRLYSQTSISQPIIIGDNVWIGGNCVILPGVSIGNNSVIGAGAVVTRNVPANQVWIGNPARYHKEIALPEDSSEEDCQD